MCLDLSMSPGYTVVWDRVWDTVSQTGILS